MPNQIQILTQNNHSKSFKVIYFDVLHVQYNSCGIVCYSLESIVSKSDNRHFRPPHSHLMPPLQRTPANIRRVLILKQGSLGYIFAADSMGLSSFKF